MEKLKTLKVSTAKYSIFSYWYIILTNWDSKMFGQLLTLNILQRQKIHWANHKIWQTYLQFSAFVSEVGVFDMPNPYRYNILSISIFCKIPLSISIFSRMVISISILIFSKSVDISIIDMAYLYIEHPNWHAMFT